MFETSLSMAVTKWANENKVDDKYFSCWQPLKRHFTGPRGEDEIGRLSLKQHFMGPRGEDEIGRLSLKQHFMEPS